MGEIRFSKFGSIIIFILLSLLALVLFIITFLVARSAVSKDNLEEESIKSDYEYPINTIVSKDDEKKKKEKNVMVVELTSVEGRYNHDEYQQKIDQIAKKYGAVGCAVALVDDGKVIDIFTYGSGIKGRSLIDEDTKIRIASLSKIYVGLATMLSVENGTMNLDEDISKYWGFDIKNVSSEDIITPRSILTHTSSISDTEEVSATLYNNMAYRLRTGSGIRNRISGDINNYYYNNYAFDVLGMTIELANDKTVDDVLKEGLYNDLDIDAAFYTGDLEDKSDIATIYKADGSVGMAASTMASWHEGGLATKGWGFAGGVTTSVKDLGKIVALLSNDGIYEGKRYLSEDLIKEMEYHENNNLGDYWQCQPLCYKNNMYGQAEFYYHTGSAYGSYNLIGYNPNTQQGIAVLTSGAVGSKDQHDVYKICGEIADVLLNID